MWKEMLKLYKEEQTPVSEKKLILRGAVAMLAIIFCLAAMSLTAYAYFTHGITSSSNHIKTAVFDIEVAIVDQGDAPVAVTSVGNKSYTARLSAGEYRITVGHSSNSTANTGFATMAVDDPSNLYYTQQLTRSEYNGTISFTLKTNTEVTLLFSARWGTSVYHGTQDVIGDFYITNDEPVEWMVEGIADTEEQPSLEPETTEPEATEPGATEPEATEPEVTEPEATEPEVTEPEVTEPEVTEPETTEPEATEPEPTEPETTEDQIDG